MSNTRNNTFNEALERINELIDKQNLNPNVLKYFKEGKVYYSYLTAGGLVGSIDTITYDPRYEAAVKDFEKEYEGYVVYHAIETLTEVGDMLSLLYVSDDPENWEGERLYQNYIASYTINFSEPNGSDFGDIIIQGFGESGALVRIG